MKIFNFFHDQLSDFKIDHHYYFQFIQVNHEIPQTENDGYLFFQSIPQTQRKVFHEKALMSVCIS